MDQTLNRMPKMKKIRVCTLFSGYDSQCMALDRLKYKHPEFDYELVAWAEIQAAGISRSQQYKMAGNSIVVDVLVAIFRQLLIGNKNAYQQLEIF